MLSQLYWILSMVIHEYGSLYVSFLVKRIQETTGMTVTCQFFTKWLSKFVNIICTSNKRFCIGWFIATESIIRCSKIFISIFSRPFYWFVIINWFWIWSFWRLRTFSFAFWISSRRFSFRTSTLRFLFDFKRFKYDILTYKLLNICVCSITRFSSN